MATTSAVLQGLNRYGEESRSAILLYLGYPNLPY